MGDGLTRALAARLSPRARRRVRWLTDRALAPVGSLRGAYTDRRVVALTYDDGPDPVHTPAVLAALAERGARATFFQLVYRAERHPDLVRATIEAGHEVALHGMDHARLTGHPMAEVTRLLREARRRLETVAGRPVRLFRPAYGAQSVRTYLATRRAGLDVVVWGPTVEDWRDGAVDEVAARAMPRIGPGEVVLLHDGFEVPAGDRTPPPTFDRGELTRALLGLLDHAGYEVSTVGQLITEARPWRTAWLR